MAKVGRPTKYEEQYCQWVIDHMAKGLSVESFAGVVHVSKSTLYEWMDNFPEFSDAVKEGREQSRLFWEKIGIDGLFNHSEPGVGSKSFNTANWIFQMKNRFKEEWRDKQEHDHSSSDGSMQPVINIIKPKDE